MTLPRRSTPAMFCFALVVFAAAGLLAQSTAEDYLTWDAGKAHSIGDSTYERGRVGGYFDTRLLKTERSYNYKLAATWLTPDVIRATARLEQLRLRLSVEQARALVADAEAAGDTVIMVE